MFGLSTQITTETTWETLIRQEVNLSTDIDYINNTGLVDWQRFIVLCPKEGPGTKIYQRPS